MITEDYVSFETAKLLKEKGFDDEYTNAFYDKNGNLYFIDILSDFSEHPDNDTDITASTLYGAMKWLREVHNLCIEPYRTACGYLYTISTIPYGSCKCNPKVGGDDEDSGQWTTYEGACESAINYCLTNLI